MKYFRIWALLSTRRNLVLKGILVLYFSSTYDVGL